jgi:hypothetical protein
MRFILPFLLAISLLAGQSESLKRDINSDVCSQDIDFTGSVRVGSLTISEDMISDVTNGATFTGKIEFSGVGHAGLEVSTLTDAERDALTDATGDLYLISDTGTLQMYDGTALQELLHIAESITPAQGDLIYHNGTNWVLLTAGSAGEYLETQGAGANPQWSSPAGSGDMLKSVYDANADNAIDIGSGGTGATTASGARSALSAQLTDVSLDAIAASTWTGLASITTLGTIATGTWEGTAIAGAYVGAHASNHIDGGADAIDGDKIEITYTDNGAYTASTSPAEVDAADQLSAHLEGIDTALGNLDTSKASTTHASAHIDGGSDAIDGDKIEITYTASDYTPTTSPAEADSTDDLTAHLAGIDTALGAGDVGYFSVQVLVYGATTATEVGDGAGGVFFTFPHSRSGSWNLTDVEAVVYVAGTTSTTDIQLSRGRGDARTFADILTTVITIDATEVSSDDAATPAVIGATNDDMVGGDVIRIDIDAIASGSAAQGLSITLGFTRQ